MNSDLFTTVLQNVLLYPIYIDLAVSVFSALFTSEAVASDCSLHISNATALVLEKVVALVWIRSLLLLSKCGEFQNNSSFLEGFCAEIF